MAEAARFLLTVAVVAPARLRQLQASASLGCACVLGLIQMCSDGRETERIGAASDTEDEDGDNWRLSLSRHARLPICYFDPDKPTCISSPSV